MITLEIMYQNTFISNLSQPSNCLNIFNLYPVKYLKSCLGFFKERGSPTSFKVKHLQYYIEGVLFAVTLTKENFPPISRTENM